MQQAQFDLARVTVAAKGCFGDPYCDNRTRGFGMEEHGFEVVKPRHGAKGIVGVVMIDRDLNEQQGPFETVS